MCRLPSGPRDVVTTSGPPKTLKSLLHLTSFGKISATVKKRNSRVSKQRLSTSSAKVADDGRSAVLYSIAESCAIHETNYNSNEEKGNDKTENRSPPNQITTYTIGSTPESPKGEGSSITSNLGT